MSFKTISQVIYFSRKSCFLKRSIHLSLRSSIWFTDKLRGGSRAAVTSKMERFVIIVNGFQPLTIITKSSILDVAAALDPPLNLPQSNSRLFTKLTKVVLSVECLIADYYQFSKAGTKSLFLEMKLDKV